LLIFKTDETPQKNSGETGLEKGKEIKGP